ncbi:MULTISPECIES: o-succinylbenzoate synthase [Pontibacillus]|uniref:o-succinylbenzoate synthase n=1 Tax=Pontibacillus chungwhensis TaxID=265426 RepID=A0ABY8UUK6_9BACI|nr:MULTISPECIES: o-succinylbenzoate synthase [Pontibacillus]MCD5325100.1 o-succinylbenzoate synthase [Pontibacillus sp. HN14]WIF97350.1 o-succinylbenzoate synthase [Pontibacillus chungwhensis]
MNLASVKLYRYTMELVTPFTTHAGTVKEREGILVEAMDADGCSGWGEGVAFSTPFYTAETVETCWVMLRDHFLPVLEEGKVQHPSELPELLKKEKGHQMAKAALEGALWDLYAKQNNQSFPSLIGGTQPSIPVGVVISLSENLNELVPLYESLGYKRIKVKVRKGHEREDIEAVKGLSSDLSIMFDGNGAYEEEDLDHLASLDDLGLLMIEQPFAAGDFYLHRELQGRMNTPICLDESIESYHDAYQAIQFGSCKTINIKISRVGGLTEAMKIYNLCESSGVDAWCGGMLETGISRAHNLAFASLPGMTIPGDLSASKRYWHEDVIIPEVELQNGQVEVPHDKAGIGFEINQRRIEQITEHTFTYHFKEHSS